MGMVTRCPACSTLFRVTPLQLQAHRGQVRCGVCHHAFDGFGALEAEPEEHAADTRSSSEVTVEDESHGLPEIVVPESVPTLFPFVDVDPPGAPGIPRPYAWVLRRGPVAATTAMQTAVVNPAPVAITADVQADTAASGEAAASWAASVTVPPGELPVPGAVVHPAADTGERAPAVEESPDPPLEETTAAPKVRHRWPWALGSLLLTAVAAAQGLQQFGGEIAARQPALRPVLQRACGLIACSLSLPQRPKLINIEASDLQSVDPARPGLIQLTATLRNHAGYDLAYPSIDLVLTNTRDHTLARRIFRPREYLSRGANVAAGVPSSGEFTVRLDLDTGDLAASGFRLDLLPAPPE